MELYEVVQKATIKVFAKLCNSKNVSDIEQEIYGLPKDKILQRPKSREHGDWSSNIAMQLAKKNGLNALEVANQIASEVKCSELVKNAVVVKPGFINIFENASGASNIIKQILNDANNFGTIEKLNAKKINLEFVSANPTGPIHVAGARWAAFGDSLANILTSQGINVEKEYYFNDAGSQIDNFVDSLIANYKNEKVPENGYAGEYIGLAVKEIIKQAGKPPTKEKELKEFFRKNGTQIMFKSIKKQLKKFRVEFDVYFHENDLYKSGEVANIVDYLTKNNYLYKKDGAMWLKTTEFGDDKDRVVIKSNGEYAYIAGDIAYIKNKVHRGANKCILMLGADHHGYINRLKAAAQMLGYKKDTVEVIIGQTVTLVKNNKPVKMSKRSGTVIALEDLIEATSVDAARYSLVRSNADSPLEIDLDILIKHNNDNPVYYVQYAHARTCAVSRRAKTVELLETKDFDGSFLNTQADKNLIATLWQYSSVLNNASASLAPHKVARYLEKLAGEYHSWYTDTRIIPFPNTDIEPINIARLALNNATKQVIKNGLKLLGVNAPEQM